MKYKIIATVITTIVIVSAGTSGGVYWNKKVTTEKEYLQEQIALREQENKKLRKKVYKLTKENKTSIQGDTTVKKSEEELVRQTVFDSASQNSEVEIATINNIKISNGWATANANPVEQNIDGQRYLLKKENGAWKVKEFGSDLSREDFPDSPAEIW